MSKLQVRNEMVINAPVGKIWNAITDIGLLPKINPGVIKATGSMGELNGTRTCQLNNRGKMGTMTERLIEMVPNERTVWTIVNDDMGMAKMLNDTRFCFHLQKLDAGRTRVVNETWYIPANMLARIMNALVMKKMIAKAQEQILVNLKKITE